MLSTVVQAIHLTTIMSESRDALYKINIWEEQVTSRVREFNWDTSHARVGYYVRSTLLTS